MTLWPGYYDVVILPPPFVRDYAIALSRRLQRAGGRWSLGKNAFLPHISLYHIPVAPENFGAFTNALEEIAHSTKWGTLETSSFDMPLLMFNKPEWLKQLQRNVVRSTVEY